jgi:hypothetical protein
MIVDRTNQCAIIKHQDFNLENLVQGPVWDSNLYIIGLVKLNSFEDDLSIHEFKVDVKIYSV